MCHVSRVTCHVSRVTCRMFFFIYFLFFYPTKFFKSGGAHRWRVCYQRGLPRLVSQASLLPLPLYYKPHPLPHYLSINSLTPPTTSSLQASPLLPTTSALSLVCVSRVPQVAECSQQVSILHILLSLIQHFSAPFHLLRFFPHSFVSVPLIFYLLPYSFYYPLSFSF